YCKTQGRDGIIYAVKQSKEVGEINLSPFNNTTTDTRLELVQKMHLNLKKRGRSSVEAETVEQSESSHPRKIFLRAQLPREKRPESIASTDTEL
ncbi:MAG: hypothetical protein Q9214_007269, partial [Letrouitia sp. 1 TL-2023]